MKLAFVIFGERDDWFIGPGQVGGAAAILFGIALVLRLLRRKERTNGKRINADVLLAASGIALFVLFVVMCIVDSDGPIY